MARVLYITYDGVLEPLGHSQVLAYLEKLAASHTITLLSFEKPAESADATAKRAVTARLRAAGIRWRRLRYHKRPTGPATAWDIAAGVLVGLWLVVAGRVRIVHARSYVPALIALVLQRLTGARFVFDMRGFWADERVEGGLWPAGGRLYRIAKALERRFLRDADHIVTLTNASVAALRDFPGFRARGAEGRHPAVSVIPTCADLSRFPLRPRPAKPPFVFGYVGSMGTWYMLEETVAAFAAVLERRPDAHLLVVNRGEHGPIRAAVARAGIPPERLELVAARHAEVPALVGRMHAASALYRPGFSRIAAAPTKLAEYLACGVPCLGSAGVGDMAEILEDNRVGVALTGFGRAEIAEAADRLLALAVDRSTRKRCVATAARLFSLEAGVAGYAAIYARLSEPGADQGNSARAMGSW